MLVKPWARLSVVLLVMLLAAAAFAGTTGKIAGAITDKQTGEPLPGVNVIIAGTNIGAATNIQYPGHPGKVQAADQPGRFFGGPAVHRGDKPDEPVSVSVLHRSLPDQSAVSNRIGQRIPRVPDL